MQLGGRDFDEALLDILLDRVEEERGCDLSEEVDAMKEILLEVQRCKCELTSNESVLCKFGPLELLDGADFSAFETTFTKQEFEEACAEKF